MDTTQSAATKTLNFYFLELPYKIYHRRFPATCKVTLLKILNGKTFYKNEISLI